jgi:hypothetical protein
MTRKPRSRCAWRSRRSGDDLEGVDVEAGVGFVEDAYFGSSIMSWRISLRFFSPPEKPSLTLRLVKLRSISSWSMRA